MEKQSRELFSKENLVWMGIGALLMIAGILLMSGGKSPDPTVFDDKEVYSARRITWAPILIIAGLATEVYAIMRGSRS
ncbi:MAG: DUF3098 domain-containing protein [Chitinophagia bacterium]|nr:DUF3098 domain-containing protein [Chitinophagia bacterium]